LHRPLIVASTLLLALNVLHILDHVRQGRELPAALSAVGAVGLGISIAVLIAAATRHRLAPEIAIAAGISTVIGIVAVHLLPRWSASFSDPYSAARVDALSWASIFALIAAGVVLAAIGMAAARSGLTGARPGGWRDA
jgi:hypothetical protein